MRGGQADDEASGLYGEAVKDHNELLNPLVARFETLLQELVQAKNRQDSSGQTSTLGKLKVRVNKAFCQLSRMLYNPLKKLFAILF